MTNRLDKGVTVVIDQKKHNLECPYCGGRIRLESHDYGYETPVVEYWAECRHCHTVWTADTQAELKEVIEC